MWRGMRRLAAMQLGVNLASERYGESEVCGYAY